MDKFRVFVAGDIDNTRFKYGLRMEILNTVMDKFSKKEVIVLIRLDKQNKRLSAIKLENLHFITLMELCEYLADGAFVRM